MNQQTARSGLLNRVPMLALLGAALITFASNASAVLLTQNIGFTTVRDVRGLDPALDFQAAIPLFDAGLGTLNQVDIRYNFDLTLDMSVSNRTLNPTSVDLSGNALRIEGRRFFDRFQDNGVVAQTDIDDVFDVPAGTERTIGSITLVLPGRAQTSAQIDSRFSRTSRTLQIRNIVLRPQGDVTPFIGSGDMLLDFSAFTLSPLALPVSGSFFNGISSSTFWTLGGSVDVTYDYTAAVLQQPASQAPSPASLSLLIPGLFAVSRFRRRKSVQQAKQPALREASDAGDSST